MLIPNQDQLNILRPIMEWLNKEVVPPVEATGYEPVQDDPLEDLYNLMVPRKRWEVGLEAATGPIPVTGLLRKLSKLDLEKFAVPLSKSVGKAPKVKKTVAGWNRPTANAPSASGETIGQVWRQDEIKGETLDLDSVINRGDEADREPFTTRYTGITDTDKNLARKWSDEFDSDKDIRDRVKFEYYSGSWKDKVPGPGKKSISEKRALGEMAEGSDRYEDMKTVYILEQRQNLIQSQIDTLDELERYTRTQPTATREIPAGVDAQRTTYEPGNAPTPHEASAPSTSDISYRDRHIGIGDSRAAKSTGQAGVQPSQGGELPTGLRGEAEGSLGVPKSSPVFIKAKSLLQRELDEVQEHLGRISDTGGVKAMPGAGKKEIVPDIGVKADPSALGVDVDMQKSYDVMEKHRIAKRGKGVEENYSDPAYVNGMIDAAQEINKAGLPMPPELQRLERMIDLRLSQQAGAGIAGPKNLKSLSKKATRPIGKDDIATITARGGDVDNASQMRITTRGDNRSAIRRSGEYETRQPLKDSKKLGKEEAEQAFQESIVGRTMEINALETQKFAYADRMKSAPTRMKGMWAERIKQLEYQIKQLSEGVPQ